MAAAYELKLPPWPDVDFSAFGQTETVPLSRIQKLTGSYLSRNWVAVPHVTHHDSADITELEALRARLAQEGQAKPTLLPFLVKAVATGLQRYPVFNASLDASGEKVVLKKYVHVGVAVDTPKGLLVPVLRDCERKPVLTLAGEISEIAARAREKGLPMADMMGGCMSISSLGHIGGIGFTPIINAPELAILGVCKAEWTAKRHEGELAWRLMLPLSLSYDHRVINGADAARFTAHLREVLASPGSLLD